MEVLGATSLSIDNSIDNTLALYHFPPFPPIHQSAMGQASGTSRTRATIYIFYIFFPALLAVYVRSNEGWLMLSDVINAYAASTRGGSETQVPNPGTPGAASTPQALPPPPPPGIGSGSLSIDNSIED